MLDAHNRAITTVEAMIRGWNAHDIDAYLRDTTDDIVWDDPTWGVPAVGRREVRQLGEAVLRAFPDFVYTIRQPICVAADASHCAVPWHIEATHLARLDPPGYEPTGRKTTFDGVDMITFRDDLVCRIDTHVNFLTVLEQLFGLKLLPARGSLAEKLGVRAQHLYAAWLRSRAARAAARTP